MDGVTAGDTAPAGKREVVARPWLEYRGALNDPLGQGLFSHHSLTYGIQV